MSRTIISLPPELHERIRYLAAQKGISMAEFIRRALAEKAAEERPMPQFGAFDSGYTDVSRRISEESPEYPSWR